MRRRRLLAAALLVAAACAPSPATSAPSAETASPPLPLATGTVAPTATPASTSSPTPSPRVGPAIVERVDTLASGLEAPWAIDVAPDGRIFLTERAGRIRVIKNGVLQPTPWLVLPAGSAPDQEMGLLGLALDPDFARNGSVYVYYTYSSATGLTNRLVRLRDEGERGVVDRVLLDGIPGAKHHDGGRVRVGPDGKLYLTVGDAEQGSPAQNRASLLGKILRLERDGAVPADNPFPGSFVYSLGHRHPQGLAFRPDGGLYATEHGPSGTPPLQPCCHDEVNRIEPGVNYGWPTVWGIAGDPRFRDPLLESGANDTWAPSGATFVTNPGPLRGSLLFAALRGQHLHRVVLGPDGRTVLFEERLLANQFGRLRDVFEAPDGSFYVLTSNRDGRGRPVASDDRVLRVVLR